MNKHMQLIEVKRDTGFVNIGYRVDYGASDDILTIQINFIVNVWSWGVVIVDPDGNTIIRTAQIGEDIEDIVIWCDDMEFRYNILYCDDCDVFEIYIL